MRSLLALTAILACTACTQKGAEQAAIVDTAAETQAIEALEKAQIAAIHARDAAASTSVYTDESVFIGERGVAARGKEAIGAGFKELLADPSVKFEYTPGAKTFSKSGDLAYATAEFVETFTDPKTKKPVTLKGTNLSVWKKQDDGSWKLVADSNPAGVTG